jgi:hypothetical protein
MDCMKGRFWLTDGDWQKHTHPPAKDNHDEGKVIFTRNTI